LFGNPDSLVSGSDAANALRLVADKLAIPVAQDETLLTLRSGELRLAVGLVNAFPLIDAQFGDLKSPYLILSGELQPK
jgi:hypothetical protein